jgi:NhaP-type Na+/H+ and K+/H+ antiporter
MCSMFNHHHAMGKIWWFIFGLPFLLLFLSIGSLVVMWLWNALLPVIFGVKMINFWQAAGLLILAKILFGGFHRPPKPFYGRSWSRKDWKSWHKEDLETSETGEKEL